MEVSPPGLGKNGYMIRVFNLPCMLIGTDIFLPYLLKVKYHRIYDDIVQHSLPNLPFRDKTFDIVLACEVIEHLGYEAGLVLLDEIERVARERVIVITPNKAYFREGLQTPVGFNPYEAHRSSWSVKDFKRCGYKVFGVGILLSRYFRKLGHYLNLVFAYITAPFPCIADELVAIKDLKERYSHI